MVDKEFIESTVGRLTVHVSGTGSPAVLWHSLFVDERSWQRVTGELARDRRLIVITGPGHGESGDPGRRYTLRDCAQAAVEILDALGVTEPVDWVGNAWGGHVGVLVATAYSHRVASLVMIGTPVQELDAAERRRMRLLLGAHRLLGPAGFIADGLVETMLSPATRVGDPEAVALVRHTFVEAGRRGLRNAVVCISLRRENLIELLPDVTVPTLMITGEQHSGFTPAQAASAAAALPNGRVAVVPDAAYLVPLEQPNAVVGLVRGFWAQIRTEPSGGRA